MKLAIPDHLLRVPPLEAFSLARDLGSEGIEITVSSYSVESHPLFDAEGVSALTRKASELGLAIGSASASFVTRWGLVDPQAEVRQRCVSMLERLMNACQAAAVPVLHLPCHGASEPHTSADEQVLLEVLRPLARQAADAGLTLAIDTLEPADACRAWLAALSSPAVRAAYDVGNARAANRDVVSELQLLGESLAQVRLRDRARREPFASVPLGEGGLDWPRLFQTLAQRAFAGWLILDSPSGDEPRAAAQRNIAFVKQLLA